MFSANGVDNIVYLSSQINFNLSGRKWRKWEEKHAKMDLCNRFIFLSIGLTVSLFGLMSCTFFPVFLDARSSKFIVVTEKMKKLWLNFCNFLCHVKTKGSFRSLYLSGLEISLKLSNHWLQRDEYWDPAYGSVNRMTSVQRNAISPRNMFALCSEKTICYFLSYESCR